MLAQLERGLWGHIPRPCDGHNPMLCESHLELQARYVTLNVAFQKISFKQLDKQYTLAWMMQ